MSRIFIVTAAMLLLFSCKKEQLPEQHPAPHPQMRYTDMQNTEIRVGRGKSFDLNGDGKTDFGFGTTRVGDPILQRDRLLFEVYSGISSFLLNNEQEETPPVLKGDKIPIDNPAFEWNEISALILAEKVTFVSGEWFWDGIWKTASHKYLPLHIKSGGQIYYGWIELSFDKQNEKIILHKAAVSLEAGKAVKAGY